MISSRDKIRLGLLSSVRANRDLLTSGNMLVLDPSCGSGSSLPGYAVYEEGELTFSGVLEIGRTGKLSTRLRNLLEEIQAFEGVDVVVVEGVPDAARGRGRSRKGHASLLKSVGVCLAALDVPVVSCDARLWSSIRGEGYEKSDEMDAIMMGRYVLNLLEEVDCESGK